MTNPYAHDDDDDDQPTLQRVAPTSSKIAVAPALFNPFPDEATTATDLDAIPPVSPIADARDFQDLDTEKMPVELRAGLVRASQVEDGA